MINAQSEYTAATNALSKYCEEYTDLTPVIAEGEYPIKVSFIPDKQMTIFGNENINADGTTNELTVTVGLTTSVKSTLKFKMDSKQLKKLIKLAEKVGTLYYQAFREYQQDVLTPRRPLVQPGGGVVCPGCGHESIPPRNGLFYCCYCGRALDASLEDENQGEGAEE